MRCPKCQYISFESSDRCRNCGYEFSLSVETEQFDVKIARDEPASSRGREGTYTALDTPLNPPSERGVGSPLAAADLPLFTDRVADDQAPLVTPPSVPRAPLSVRKAAPSRPRSQSPLPEELSLDLGVEDDQPEGLRGFGAAAASLPPEADASVPLPPAVAGLVRRAIAGIIDVLILGSISAAVVVLTLRVCELTIEQWRMLPPVPMLAFLMLLCGGYFVLFTAAGGQTIGKMAAHIRVVNGPDVTPARVSFRTAVVRTVACLGSVLAFGAGFLLAVINEDRCAFHDRVAETRVVPA
jgi:uncharacterized RDD family membrane protein YckC